MTARGADSAAHPRLLVLSAGRTGTVFLARFLRASLPGATVVHEPWPTREQMMLGNLRNDLGILGGVTRAWVTASRARREAAATGPYIEINPFLCAVTDLLPDPGRPLRIVHLVRAPESWARSMTAFKASRRFRAVIDYVPFAKPAPVPRPAGWRRASEYQRNLARWRWCNERILALAPAAEAFTTLRYETLFGADAAARGAVVEHLFATLGLDRPAAIDWERFRTRANPAPAGNAAFAAPAPAPDPGIDRLAQALGYDI